MSWCCCICCILILWARVGVWLCFTTFASLDLGHIAYYDDDDDDDDDYHDDDEDQGDDTTYCSS